ncbi:heme ABC transporter ATP-binding protein [Stagnimonas aquatica]|uniref:Heme ABC transporter ATP-binding protein n=1 Tax=Stagnimonas aquatica TaxID=2689987 RepID=A0A3N0VEQ2_9GAMM|nr:heme ABC transporter ATP-binding protein [Stagnimonas aquatica]ROH91144.1 heme ABC transporter ATP-binding protein [Stagnimonas aquatica]
MLIGRDLHWRFGGRRLLDGVSLTLRPGELHAVLGVNGAGKSTLLKLLAGDLHPSEGEVLLNQRPMRAWSLRQRARLRAVLPQGDNLRFAFSAREVVALGRQAAVSGSPAEEAALIDAALADADVLPLAERSYLQLSGGERQRVQLARVLAQLSQPPAREPVPGYLLLDEPTAALDLAHQHACMALLRRKLADGLGVLAVLHDINLAGRYADTVSLLHQGRMLAQGTPSEVLRPELLGRAYGSNLRFLPVGDPQRPHFDIAVADPD